MWRRLRGKGAAGANAACTARPARVRGGGGAAAWRAAARARAPSGEAPLWARPAGRAPRGEPGPPSLARARCACARRAGPLLVRPPSALPARCLREGRACPRGHSSCRGGSGRRLLGRGCGAARSCAEWKTAAGASGAPRAGAADPWAEWKMAGGASGAPRPVQGLPARCGRGPTPGRVGLLGSAVPMPGEEAAMPRRSALLKPGKKRPDLGEVNRRGPDDGHCRPHPQNSHQLPSGALTDQLQRNHRRPKSAQYISKY